MKPRILALLHFSYQQERQFAYSFSDAERSAIGTPDSWAAKDFLVNIMRWKQLQTEKLTVAVRGGTPPVWRDMQLVHQINKEAFIRYQAYSIQEIQEEAKRIFNAFITQV